jgi:hypothetical protein
MYAGGVSVSTGKMENLSKKEKSLLKHGLGGMP